MEGKDVKQQSKYKILHNLKNLFFFLWFVFLMLELTQKIPGTGYSLSMFALKLIFEIHRDELDELIPEETKELNKKVYKIIICIILSILISTMFMRQQLTNTWLYASISAGIALIVIAFLKWNRER